MNRLFGSCRDLGAAARRNPDITFIVYHSGFDTKAKEGPFEAGKATSGIDTLIQSLLDSGVDLAATCTPSSTRRGVT